jgi:signal transduction histidine kinase
LVQNALKYSKSGDAITIFVDEIIKEDSEDEHIEFQISVIDQGPGIEVSERKHLFEPFFRCF